MALFHLGKNSRDTYYEQLRGQLILHVLCSNLKIGDKLPAIRDTARMLRVNPNTIFNIYRRLQTDHLLEIRRGSGTYVGKSIRHQPAQRGPAQVHIKHLPPGGGAF